MQTAIRFIVSGLILLGIIGFMTTYTVRFTDSAVLSTFGKADEFRDFLIRSSDDHHLRDDFADDAAHPLQQDHAIEFQQVLGTSHAAAAATAENNGGTCLNCCEFVGHLFWLKRLHICLQLARH